MPTKKQDGFNFRNNGFTLIELLVVVVIIVILTSFLLVALTQIQKNTRDAKRKSDLRVVAAALERFYSDNSHYPKSSSGQISIGIKCSDAGSTTLTWGISGITCTISGVDKTYTKQLPHDPSPGHAQYCYESTNSGQGYNLAAVLENSSDKEAVTSFICATKHGYNFLVTPTQ